MSAIQMPLPGLVPASDWKPPTLGELPSWRDAARVGIDIETHDPTLNKMRRRHGMNRGSKLGPGMRHGGYVAGVSFAIEDGRDYYLPLRHAGGGNVDAERALEYLRDQARDFTGELVGLNLPYDLDYLQEADVDFTRGDCELIDVGVADCVLDELWDDYTLDGILARRGLAAKDETHLREVAKAWGVDPKKGLWKLPAADVAAYAERDARAPLEVWTQQRGEIEESGQSRAWDVERALTPILIRMTARGVRYSASRLDRVESWAASEEAEALRAVHHHTGVRIKPGDTNRADAVAPALRAIGVELRKTKKTGKDKITAQLLDSLDHPVGELLRWAKKMDKLQGFAFATRVHAVRGRVHCRYNQTKRSDEDGDIKGTRSNRLSATHTNIQQQFARDADIGPLWRSIWLAEPGEDWHSSDFSQQEPRLAVHYAADCGLHGADVARARYAESADLDFHQFMADLTGLPRKVAKNIWLGLAYGMGEEKFCATLGLPVQRVWRKDRWKIVAGPEGRAMLDQFHREAPWLKQLAKKVERLARKRGWIKLLFGKLAHFPTGRGGGYDWTHKAFNRLIQGGSALQMKKAMVDADAAGIPLVATIHDELVNSVRRGAAGEEEAEALRDVMRRSVDLLVPSKVDGERGPSWGESMLDPRVAKNDDDLAYRQKKLAEIREFYQEAA